MPQQSVEVNTLRGSFHEAVDARCSRRDQTKIRKFVRLRCPVVVARVRKLSSNSTKLVETEPTT